MGNVQCLRPDRYGMQIMAAKRIIGLLTEEVALLAYQRAIEVKHNSRVSLAS